MLKRICESIPFLPAAKRARERRMVAAQIYGYAVQLARRPSLYGRYGIEDSVDGRFDMIALMLSLALRPVRKELGPVSDLGREITSIFVMDMDRSLREMGVGDLSVGKHIKKMAQAFYGRLQAYDQALSGDVKMRESRMAEALLRNLYREDEKKEAEARLFAASLVKFDKALEACNTDSIAEGAMISVADKIHELEA